MNRNGKILLTLLILLSAASLALLLLRPKPERSIARITLDGRVVKEIDLDALREPVTLTLEGPGGFSNTILAEPGRVCVESAGCPDQICVQQGFITDGTVPIVCLPNRLIIEITGGGDELDAAAG